MPNDGRLADLVEAYGQADYAAWDAPRREVAVRIGVPSPAMDRLLGRHGARGGTFVTAWNPRSVRRSIAANEAASARLRRLIEADGRRWLPHEGRSPSADWFERGFLVLDLPTATARAWAVRFGQNAVVQVARGGAPALLITARRPP